MGTYANRREASTQAVHTGIKAAAIASGSKAGASVALEPQVNANMLRLVDQAVASSRAEEGRGGAADPLQGPSPGSLPVALADQVRLRSPPSTLPSPSFTERAIRVRIRKGSSRITIELPTSAADACAAWLRELIA